MLAVGLFAEAAGLVIWLEELLVGAGCAVGKLAVQKKAECGAVVVLNHCVAGTGVDGIAAELAVGRKELLCAMLAAETNAVLLSAEVACWAALAVLGIAGVAGPGRAWRQE